MNNTEYEPLAVANFRDVAYQLPDGEGLFLSRNTVYHVRRGVMSIPQPVHYEAIDDLTIEGRSSLGKLVSEEFREVALWVYSDERHSPRESAYPLITVINNTTGAVTSLSVDVAELILQGYISIYAKPSRECDEEDILSTDLTTLIEDLIKEVGVEPDQALLTARDGVRSLRDIDLTSEASLRRAVETSSPESAMLSVHPRGEAALNLLQTSVSRAFAASKYKGRETERSNNEVVLQVQARPDLQALVLMLIDMIEARGELLYCHRELSTSGEKEFVISVVSRKLQVIEELTREASLDIALYRAYRRAWEIFPEA